LRPKTAPQSVAHPSFSSSVFCHSKVRTLADERQKRKQFLSVNRTFLTVDRLNLSFRIEGFQRVEPFPFLTTKNPRPNPPPERVPNSAGEGGGCWILLREDRNAVLSNANRLHFAEQNPQVAKSRPNERPLAMQGCRSGNGSIRPLGPIENRSRWPLGFF
jgi:hypothetical protein